MAHKHVLELVTLFAEAVRADAIACGENSQASQAEKDRAIQGYREARETLVQQFDEAFMDRKALRAELAKLSK